MSTAGLQRRDAADLRKRAVLLLESFFANDSESARRTVFQEAFGEIAPDPSKHLRFSTPVAEFAAEAVDKLIAFGGAGRGRHYLSLLLATMREIRGRQADPDYYDLQVEFDTQCALPTREEEQRYLARLIDDIEEKAQLYSPLHGIAQTRPAEEKAERSLLRAWREDPDLALLRHSSRRRDIVNQPAQQHDYDDILTAFADVRRAALLGAPGSGKSTTLRKLALELATRARTDSQAPLPLLAALGDWRGDETLSDFLTDAAPEIGWAVTALSEVKRLVVLLDGLNEVPTAKRAAKATGVVRLQDELHRNTAIIVSCRREDYVGDLDLGLDTLTLEPLSPQRILAAVRQWVGHSGEPVEMADRFFWQLAGDERLAEVLEEWLPAASEDSFWTASDPWNEYEELRGRIQNWDLWYRHIPDPRSLVRLASNPFMLTMLFQVWVSQEGALPQNRGDLFGRFINRLLSREGLLVHNVDTGEWHQKPEGERLLAGLAGLAWWMQTERIGAGKAEGGDFGVLTVAPRSVGVQTLGNEALVQKVLAATLLEGGDELRFRHQLLQEYFTAKALEARLEQTAATDLWPPDRWWERSGWEETAVLLAGFRSSDCTDVIRWLADAQPETAAQCILESGAEIADRPGLLRDLQTAWLPRLSGPRREPQPEARASVGRALGRLGLDSRRGVGVDAGGVPDIEWVEIPGGKFLYQEGERRKIDPFLIARFPVTNAQYQAFMDAEDGHRQDRWWKGFSDPDRQPRQPSWSESNHPRETVSWHEAMAFCAWLGHKLGRDVTLPTEWQWERATRGTDGRIYPWGDDYLSGYANVLETGEAARTLGRTTAVGLYPEGASPEGVLDLSGNVWEWCLNEYAKPKHTGPAGKGSRVLRGGSWGNGQDGARAGGRGYVHPGGRDGIVGFRVVCSSPIADH